VDWDRVHLYPSMEAHEHYESHARFARVPKDYARFAEAAPPEGEPSHDIDWSELNRQLSGGSF
jgi:hypothetical protein